MKQTGLNLAVAGALALVVSACAVPGGPGSADWPAGVDVATPASDLLLLGELHDDPRHQRWHREAVAVLADRGRLAALALEMAERGTSTAGLPRDATETAVRKALQWDDQAWPWAAYGPAIMAAVQAGVPVLGANLPRAQMRPAMADASLDQRLAAGELERQRQAVRDGHCGLLPDTQVGHMTRVQVARDVAMAEVIAAAARRGQTVVLLAGNGHVDPQVGIPRHLPSSLTVRPVTWPAPPAPAKDYCAQLRQQWQPRNPPARQP